MTRYIPSGPQLFYPLSLSLHSSTLHFCYYNQYSEDFLELRLLGKQRCEMSCGKEDSACQACCCSVNHTQNFSHHVGGRGGNCTQEAKTSLHSSLLSRGSYPEPNFFPSSHPLTYLREDGKKEKVVIQSVFQNLLIYFQESERPCLHNFHFISV